MLGGPTSASRYRSLGHSLKMFEESLLCVHAPSACCHGSLTKLQDPSWVRGWLGAILPSPPPPAAPGQHGWVFLRQAAGWRLCARRSPQERRQLGLELSAEIALRRGFGVTALRIKLVLRVPGACGPARLQLLPIYPAPTL